MLESGDIARNPEQHSERERRKNTEDPSPRLAQYNCGERDLDEVEQAERIRRASAQRENQRQTQRVQTEQCADGVLGVDTEAMPPGTEQPVAQNLNSNRRSNHNQRKRDLKAEGQRSTQHDLAGNESVS